MVELHDLPPDGPVALLAVVSEPGPEAVVLAPNPVAVVAPVGGALELSLEVTRRARDLEVVALELERRRLVEVPRGGAPARGRVTGLALLPERPPVAVLVAGAAVRRAARETDGDSAGRDRLVAGRLVARLALGRGVLANEELGARPVPIGLHGEGGRGVAVRAGRAELALVDVFVARRAGRGGAGKANRRAGACRERPGLSLVTLGARHLLVLASERELRPAVVEGDRGELRFSGG